ncbi:MAG: hypothetical protein Q8O89_08105 [Nanoarchaeota archaeon]|nr:hypothetical protein [Nanoarchaeota archaeon]
MVNETIEAINLAANATSNLTVNNGVHSIYINQSVNASALAEFGRSAVNVLKEVFWPRLVEILQAPIIHPQMLWMTVPLIGTLFLMMFYFSRYKREDLGWNTAVGNSLVLIFVGIDLLRHLTTIGIFKLANLTSLNANVKIIVTLFILFEGGMLLLANFTHAIPKRFAFFISSPIYVNLTAYMGLVVVYSDIPMDLITIIATVLLYCFFLLAFFILRRVVPESAKDFDIPSYDSGGGYLSSASSARRSKKPRKDNSDSGWIDIDDIDKKN